MGHHHKREEGEPVSVAVVTISSTRSLKDDPSGDLIENKIESAGHAVTTRELIPDDHDRIQGLFDRLVGRDDVMIVISTGGTGITPDDVTIEAVSPLLEKDIPGFGEHFRRLSFESVGTRALASRAAAGVADGVPVFCLPGSKDAVSLGMEELILPEADHLVQMATRE
ncbi:MAG: molybdenum cofactor biosynthesis protein B [Halobacteriaceae archaeon]